MSNNFSTEQPINFFVDADFKSCLYSFIKSTSATSKILKTYICFFFFLRFFLYCRLLFIILCFSLYIVFCCLLYTFLSLFIHSFAFAFCSSILLCLLRSISFHFHILFYYLFFVFFSCIFAQFLQSALLINFPLYDIIPLLLAIPFPHLVHIFVFILLPLFRVYYTPFLVLSTFCRLFR